MTQADRPEAITVLGATGSIGQSTLDVLARHPDRYRVWALTAHHQVDKLARLCVTHDPVFAVVGGPEQAQQLQALLRGVVSTRVRWGVDALCDVASHPDVRIVMAAIVGAAGLAPTLAAARTGKRVLLANKEALVMSGALFMGAVREHGARLLPIDSEHNAVFQSLPAGYDRTPDACGVRRVVLTASGGPFRQRSVDTLADVTPDEACAHPNWSMGRKISVDSATMMNKGLEVIEAHWLFGVPADGIEVVVHPQSVIHSLVSYRDGSMLAQLGNPDMRTPIAHALAFPERIDSGVAELDLFAVARLDFERPDLERFPCLGLAYQALRAGGAAPAVLNAANEVAVAAFLAGELPYPGIARVIEQALSRMPALAVDSIEAVMAADRAGRRLAHDALACTA